MSRRLLHQFDQRTEQIVHALKQTQESHRKSVARFRSPWVAADKRHAYPTGLTLVDHIRTRRQGRGVAAADEEGAHLVDEDAQL